jgi:hypothetical protein
MTEDSFTLNDIIKKLHKEGATGKLDFRKIKCVVCDGNGYPYLKVEYPQEKQIEEDWY